MDSLPVIDVSPLIAGETNVEITAEQIGSACRDAGFFYVIGHGVDEALIERLEQLSREFFARDGATKLAIAMKHGGRAWRGYFPVGAELTSGQPDQKEGLYFGNELAAEHPLVRAGTPMHGPNLFPPIPGFRSAVLDYMDALTALGHRLMEGLALSLDLNRSYFADRYTADPLILFRIFHYPPLPDDPSAHKVAPWSVGEHTDYGLLTILHQDEQGGLQVKSQHHWIDAPPIADSFVCNIGDMLDRMTRGWYRSTPHRVRNRGKQSRLSFPFFFDPAFDAAVRGIDNLRPAADDKARRWDQASVHEFDGTYGDYLLNKVAKVFPDLVR